MSLWCWQQAHWRWPQFFGMVSVLVAAVLVRRWWVSQICGTLHWDGTRWTLEGHAADSVFQVSVQLDLQQHLLLRLARSNPAAHVWLWLERDSNPALWRDLRRAVYSPAPSPASDAGHNAVTPP